MRLLQDDSHRTWKMDCRVWREAWRLPFRRPGHPVSSSNGGSTHEPAAEIVDCRGGARSQEVRQRIITTDKGPPHLEGHRDLEMVRMLLGHAKIESTARFLRVPTTSDPILVSRAFDI